ncbi:hypothetical protein HD806DRAFT_418610 [Xylariaceae sp. AK1471]|nr:hypothetical protein HD806DRAFT_418610 [Xylariaceae sp. AK1471]
MDLAKAPFTTNLLQPIPAAVQGASAGQSSAPQATIDNFPASFRDGRGDVRVPSDDPGGFLSKELSLDKLHKFDKYLWAVGAKRPAAPLNSQIFYGREIVVSERMDLHLVWTNDGRLFIKPLPRFLLDPTVWRDHLICKVSCKCQPASPAVVIGDAKPTLLPDQDHGSPRRLGGNESGANGSLRSEQKLEDSSPSNQEDCPKQALRKCALGFLYTYVCLISYESDFAIAKEKGLLPRLGDNSEICWDDWKKFVNEFLTQHDKANIHTRFHRGELRLSRLNTISRFTQWPLFTSYIRGWRNYSSLVRDNITSLATATIFIALILTAMQVALATDQLMENSQFMAVSYGFSIFAILAPFFVIFLVILGVIYNLLKDNLLSRKFFKNPVATENSARVATTREHV